MEVGLYQHEVNQYWLKCSGWIDTKAKHRSAATILEHQFSCQYFFQI